MKPKSRQSHLVEQCRGVLAVEPLYLEELAVLLGLPQLTLAAALVSRPDLFGVRAGRWTHLPQPQSGAA